MDPTAAASRAVGVGVPGDVHVATLARAVVWTAVLATLAQGVIGAANALVFESRLLNPDAEGSVFQLLTAATTAVAGAAAATHALRLPARRRRFAALAVILLYFAVDDVLVIHERVGEQIGDVFGLPAHIAVRMWILALGPVLVAAFVLLAAEALRAARPLRRVLLGGLGALVAAVAVEVVGVVTRSPAFIDRVSGKPETLRTLVEESFELGGWVLLAGGLAALVAHELRTGAAGGAADVRPH